MRFLTSGTVPERAVERLPRYQVPKMETGANRPVVHQVRSLAVLRSMAEFLVRALEMEFVDR